VGVTTGPGGGELCLLDWETKNERSPTWTYLPLQDWDLGVE